MLPSFKEIQDTALAFGWDDVGLTKAIIPDADIEAYKEWLQDHKYGDLEYMKNEIRCQPEKLFPGAKTAIIFVSYYKQEKLPFREDAGLIASYARGKKYHNVHHKRLKKFIQWLEERTGYKNIAKGFSDSCPVLEKALAVQAGLGWFGKNTLLIHRKFGTFTLLSGLFTSLEFSEVIMNARIPRCGSCNRCLQACPVQAFDAPYKLNAGKCLSYHLIESKKGIPEEVLKSNPGYIFGCDICQDVCPHNVKKPISSCSDFSPEQGMGAYLSLNDLEQFEGSPEKLYGTPLQRRKLEGLKKTAKSLRAYSKSFMRQPVS